jgi:hypothetical protein
VANGTGSNSKSTNGPQTDDLELDQVTFARCRGEFRPRQTRQLPRAVDLKGRFLFLVVVKC